MGVLEAERISGTDRRWWPRATVALPVRVVDTEGGFGVLSGETLNLSAGGLKAQFDGPLPGTDAVTLQLDLLGDQALVCEALIAGGGASGGRWEYGLAFQNLEPHEVNALEHLVDQCL